MRFSRHSRAAAPPLARFPAFSLFLFLALAPSAAAPPDYSKEGVVVQEFAKEIAFAADGTWTLDQTARARIQSDAGVRQFGVIVFSYNSDTQKVDILYVRVRKPDGTVVETPPDHAQDLSSEVTRFAPTYSDLREKQIPVKSLSAGDTLEYRVRFTQTKPDVPGQFWYSQNFLTGAVVLSESLEVSVPAAKFVKVVSPSLAPQIREEGGQKIYTWKTAQLAPTPAEPDKNKPAPSSITPAVQLTTFKTWDEVGRWYGELQRERVAVTPAIRAKALELTKGLTTDTDKQKAIYNYVSTQFRYISLSFGIGRYQPHSADEVLSNQYGDCKDKHTLFASLLKAAGFDAWPALIGAGVQLDPDVPSPAQFNHVITVLPEAKSFVWLDTTPEVAPFALLEQNLRDQKALVIPANGPASLVTTPSDPPFPASQVITADATLASDGTLKAHFDVTARGDDEVALRAAFHQVPPANWQQLVQGIVNSLGFAGTVSNLDVENPQNLEKPFHYSYDYTRPDHSDWPNRRISPPMLPITLPFGISDDKPTEPIALGAPGEIAYRATVHLPKEFSAEIPDGINAQIDSAVYHSSYTLTAGVLSANRQLTVKKSKIPLSAWGDYHKFAQQVFGDQNQFIQLAVSTGPAKTVTVQNNPQAETLIQQAYASLQSRDINAARDALQQAERLNPKQRNLWATYGTLYFLNNEPQKALESLQKEVQIHPDSIPAYRALAVAQTQFGHREQAAETLRTVVKMAPDDADTIYQLSSLLMADKRYQDVVDLVRQPLEKAPDNQPLLLASAEALLRSGHKEEGVAAVEKLAKNSTDAGILNNAAWFLSDTSTDLPRAKEYAEKSVSTLENDSKQLALSTLTMDELARVNLLAAAWDTLGWVYFQSGDLDKAEKYIDASWRLSEGAVVADHLGQIYAKQGKRQAAIHTWRLALATNNGLEETRERLRKMGVTPDLARPTLSRRGNVMLANSDLSSSEELGKLRTASLPELPKQEGSAEFWLLFSPAKIEDVQFISGADALKSAAPALAQAHYNLPFPDNGPEKIARRGILSCSLYTSPSCTFVLLLPSNTTTR